MATNLRTVTETAKDFSRSTGRTIDKARNQTGGALHAVASSVRKGSARIDVLANGAAKRLDDTASFVRDADFSYVLTGVKRFGQKHPACTLLAGAAVGFWIASAFTRMVRSNGRTLETTTV